MISKESKCPNAGGQRAELVLKDGSWDGANASVTWRLGYTQITKQKQNKTRAVLLA